MPAVLEYFIEKDQGALEQDNGTQQQEFDVRFYGPDGKTGFYISGDKIYLMSGDKEALKIDGQSIQMYGQISNPNSVMNETKGGLQTEFIAKEFMIPSSLVTPIPEHIPFPVMVLNLRYIVEIVDAVVKIVEAFKKFGGK